MEIIVYLTLILSQNPYPTVMILDKFRDVFECENYIKTMELPEAEAKRLQCVPVVTSKFWTI